MKNALDNKRGEDFYGSWDIMVHLLTLRTFGTFWDNMGHFGTILVQERQLGHMGHFEDNFEAVWDILRQF